MRQKIFDRKSWSSIPPPHSKINFFATGNFLKHSAEGFNYGNFRHCETKNFRQKIVILHPPPLKNKLFRYRKFSETQRRRFQLRKFSALWDRKFSTENLDTPPPLLSINFFATGNFLKHSAEGFNYEIFRHCETENFPRKILIPPPPIHKFFRYQKFSEIQHRKVHLPNFSALWDRKNFDRKSKIVT